MPRTDFLKPLGDLASCCESAALDYTGELKSALSELCRLIDEQAAGYTAPEVQAALPKLEGALESYRAGNRTQGALLMTAVSRDWWAAVDP